MIQGNLALSIKRILHNFKSVIKCESFKNFLFTLFAISTYLNIDLKYSILSIYYRLSLFMADKKIRSVAKTFSWRLFIFIYWVIFGYIFTGSIKGAGILGLGSIIPLFFYYFHERIWNKVKWGLN